MEDFDAPIDVIDTPVNARSDLSELGIEEIDKGVCLDTPFNRRLLRKAGYEWQVIFDTDEKITNKIEAISPDKLRQRTMALLESRKELLTDPRNINSDYITGVNLLVADVDNLVPRWVVSATDRYEDIQEHRTENPGKKFRAYLVSPPGRCRYVKSDQVRCSFWHSGREDANRLCKLHQSTVANNQSATLERARAKISQSSERMVEVLEELADTATSEAVRQRAADSLLDRAGIRGGSDLNISTEVTVVDAADEIRERLRRLQEGAAAQLRLEAIRTADEENTEDAVIIEDENNGNQ